MIFISTLHIPFKMQLDAKFSFRRKMAEYMKYQTRGMGVNVLIQWSTATEH
jgi:hypothetical protein